VAALSNQVQLYADKIRKLEQQLQEASMEVEQTREDAAADIISITNQQNKKIWEILQLRKRQINRIRVDHKKEIVDLVATYNTHIDDS
jgi:DNA-directed RNA polymerase subunit F